MRIIEYYLLPESGYNGEYDRKEAHYLIKSGSIADMIHDSSMLYGYDFNKYIPSYENLNMILRRGYYQRLVEWDAIEIDVDEYKEIVDALLNKSLDNPYKVE